MKRKNDFNENLIFTRGDVRFNSKKKKLVCNRNDESFSNFVDELNYICSLDDDAITNDYTGDIKVENVW